MYEYDWWSFFFLSFIWNFYECMNMIDEAEEEEDEEKKKKIKCWQFIIKYNRYAIK